MSKINLFEDKTYDKLEWLEKAVEPFVFPPNDVLAAMPERVELTFDTIWKFFKESRSLSLHLETLVVWAAETHNVEIPEGCLGMLVEHYKFVVDPNTLVDFETNTMSGGLRLIKTKNHLSDEDIVELMAVKLASKIQYISTEEPELSRWNEVLDLIGAKETRSSRSARHKKTEIITAMTAIVKEDKWRVRDVDLMIKCGDWLKKYIEDGNLAAMSNFTRLKCMVHKGAPIYSLEETK